MERRSEDTEGLTLYEDLFYEKREKEQETLQIIIFRLAQEWYGVEITKVKEILKTSKITYLPSSPESIAGIVNLRGNILSITDLKKMFGLPHEEPTEKTRIIAIASGIWETGVLVDEVVDSVKVPVHEIEPSLFTLSKDGGQYIEGHCRVGNQLIGLINVEKVFGKRD